MDLSNPEEYISKHNSIFDRYSQEELEAKDNTSILLNNKLVESAEDKYLSNESLDRNLLWDEVYQLAATHLENPKQNHVYRMLDKLQLNYWQTLNLANELPVLSTRSGLLKWVCEKHSLESNVFADGQPLVCEENAIMRRLDLDLQEFKKTLGGLDFYL